MTPEQAERIARWAPEPIRPPGREGDPEARAASRGEAANGASLEAGAADEAQVDPQDGVALDEEPGGAVPVTVH